MDRCLICGCTDLTPCVDPWDDEPHACGWFAPGLCSACRYTPIRVQAPLREDLEPNYAGLGIGPGGALFCVADPLPSAAQVD